MQLAAALFAGSCSPVKPQTLAVGVLRHGAITGLRPVNLQNDCMSFVGLPCPESVRVCYVKTFAEYCCPLADPFRIIRDTLLFVHILEDKDL